MELMSVDEYVAKFADDQAVRLGEMRALIRQVLPEATEAIKWSAPAYSTGTVLVTFAGFSRHLNLYFTPSTILAFREELADYRTGKSALSLPYIKLLPESLIADMLRFRRDEYANDGITWM